MTREPVVGPGLSTPIDPAVDSVHMAHWLKFGILDMIVGCQCGFVPVDADGYDYGDSVVRHIVEMATARAVDDLAEARAENKRHEVFMRAIKECRDDPASAIAANDIINGKAIIAAHLAECERNAARAEYAALKAAVEEIRGLALAAQGSVPAAPYTGVGWARLLELTGALAAAVPTPTECTCTPCVTPGNGGPTPGHCAACCGQSGIEEYDPECSVAEHRELAERQTGTEETPRNCEWCASHYDDPPLATCVHLAPSTPEATTPEHGYECRSRHGRPCDCWLQTPRVSSPAQPTDEEQR